jgi:hypothetical protein
MNETRKSFILDIILPATLAITAGVGTYLLTGGEDEFPTPEVRQSFLSISSLKFSFNLVFVVLFSQMDEKMIDTFDDTCIEGESESIRLETTTNGENLPLDDFDYSDALQQLLTKVDKVQETTSSFSQSYPSSAPSWVSEVSQPFFFLAIKSLNFCSHFAFR